MVVNVPGCWWQDSCLKEVLGSWVVHVPVPPLPVLEKEALEKLRKKGEKI